MLINMKISKEQLVQLIKEELVLKEPLPEGDPVRLGPGFVTKIMEQGMPVYEDELRKIMIE
jgi:hypothetical protein